MKLKFTSTALLLILLVTSCGGGSKSSSNVSSKEQASQIIEYTNQVIDYLNESGKWLRSNENKIGETISNLRESRKPSNTMFLFPSMSSKKAPSTTSKETGLSDEEQLFFDTNVASYKSLYEGLKSNLSTIKAYYQNEDYKDDNYAKGKALADSVETAYKTLMPLRATLFTKIDEVTAAAELVILEDHPLKDPIMALKGDLAGFEALADACFDMSEDKMTSDQVESMYQKLETKVNSNKALYGDALAKENEQSSYDSFYKQCDKMLGVYRKALRNVKEGKKLTEYNFEDFSDGYNSLIYYYNNFGH